MIPPFKVDDRVKMTDETLKRFPKIKPGSDRGLVKSVMDDKRIRVQRDNLKSELPETWAADSWELE